MRIFAVSDIHGYYDILRETLKSVGFRENNENDLLVCCGDYWDRGDKPYEVMTYLMSLNNVVLIKGNHEYLMESYLDRGYALRHDYQNGTGKTFQILVNKIKVKKKQPTLPQVTKIINEFYSKMVDYFETKNYVFVHGWIPCNMKGFKTDFPLYDFDWRNGNWSESCWYNGMDLADKGILVPNKTTVCGHWHCSYGWARDAKRKSQTTMSEFDDDACWDIYENEGIYAIDRCTAYTGEMNVLILEDDLL